MRLFGRFFKSDKKETKRYLTDSERKQKNDETVAKINQVKDLFVESFNIYNAQYCPCAFPRFQQFVGINCSDTGHSFKCLDTDLLICMACNGFDVTASKLTDEVTNEQWICKKCGSVYEYGWSDFSISLERRKFKLVELKTEPRGLPVIKPIPLYIGLLGYTYPSRQEITSVSFEEFKRYMTEQ